MIRILPQPGFLIAWLLLLAIPMLFRSNRAKPDFRLRLSLMLVALSCVAVMLVFPR